MLMIIAYLRNLNAGAVEKPIGNVENGAKLFASQCATCHRVGDKAAGSAPTCRASARPDRARRWCARFARPRSGFSGYETVTLVTKDGQKIRAVKKNEDVFSIQVMDTRERIQGYPSRAFKR